MYSAIILNYLGLWFLSKNYYFLHIFGYFGKTVLQLDCFFVCRCDATSKLSLVEWTKWLWVVVFGFRLWVPGKLCRLLAKDELCRMSWGAGVLPLRHRLFNLTWRLLRVARTYRTDMGLTPCILKDQLLLQVLQGFHKLDGGIFSIKRCFGRN